MSRARTRRSAPRSLGPALLAVALAGSACIGGQSNDDATAPSSPATTGAATTSTTTTTTTAPAADTSPPSPVPSPTFVTGRCRFDVPAGRSVDCGWLQVPQDRTDPESGTVRLHVAIFRSDNPDPAPDPVVYLEGGPGGDALEAVPFTFEDGFSHLLVERDVIMYDQRGTGYSEPSLACPESRELSFEVIDQDVPVEELRRLTLASIEECRDRLRADGAELDAYTSATSAADLAELRTALGIEAWNLYGISYGTRLALTTVRDHPEGIRSVVIDSVYPPDVDAIADMPGNLDRALRTFFDGCAADAACGAAYPDLEATFYGVVQALDESPLRAPVTDVFTLEVYDAVFDGSAFGAIVFQSLYAAEAIRVLPLLIDHVAAGATDELSVLASSLVANGEFVSTGVQLSVQCHDEVAFSTPEGVAAAVAAYPHLEPIFAGSPSLASAVFDVCELWGAGAAPPLENRPVTSSIPTLVMVGEYDPVTPPAWGARAAAGLERATLVEFPGLGHGVSVADACPQAILRAFLAAPDVPVDTACASAMAAPAFDADAAPSPVVLVPFTEQVNRTTVTGVVPDGWTLQAPGVWLRGSNALDQTAVVQQLAPGASPDVVLGSLASDFGLGAAPDAVGEYETPLGSWALYEGVIVASPTSVALLRVAEGTLVVAVVGSPSERDLLRAEVLFPVLGALAVE